MSFIELEIMSKLNLVLGTVLAVSVLAACVPKKDKNESASASDTTQTASEVSQEQKTETTETNLKAFDFNSLPTVNQDIGEFPYVGVPQDYKFAGKPDFKKFDYYYFPINNQYQKFEGKLSSVYVSADGDHEFSDTFFGKSFQDTMKSIGAVELNNSQPTYEQYEQIPQDIRDRGNFSANGNNMYVYGFKNKEGNPVLIQYASRKYTIMEVKAVDTTMKMGTLKVEDNANDVQETKAEDLEKSIKDTGKATVYINFAVDKATIESSSNTVITEIAKMLKQDPSLRLSIEGHTDNSGTEAHNQQLSEKRAEAVKNVLTKDGIESNRLSSKGLGQSKPIADNATEDGKAQNRRVELVKVS